MASPFVTTPTGSEVGDGNSAVYGWVPRKTYWPSSLTFRSITAVAVLLFVRYETTLMLAVSASAVVEALL